MCSSGPSLHNILHNDVAHHWITYSLSLSLLQHRHKQMLRLKSICYDSMNAEWDIISHRAEEWYVQACSAGDLRCTKDEMGMLSFIGWRLQACLALTVNCKLQRYFVFTPAFKILTLRTPLVMEIGSHELISETSFGSPNIHLVKIELCLHSNHGELRLLWVSVVHGWVGVASHLVESLHRICLLRFSLSSSSSFDRAQCCRTYFWIWK